jgi:hypothetical protein
MTRKKRAAAEHVLANWGTCAGQVELFSPPKPKKDPK